MMVNKQRIGFPVKQGMYDPSFEKDSCGVGFIANFKGVKSHQIVKDGITILNNLTHRGATGSDPDTGDGAGLLIQIPHRFFKKVCGEIGIDLPAVSEYGIGVIFLPSDPGEKEAIENVINESIANEGLAVLGWRDVPIDKNSPGKTAQAVMPTIRQVFIKGDCKDQAELERKLYVTRKVLGTRVRQLGLKQWELYHIPSFSSRTIVYKGMLIASQLATFYHDINDPDMMSALALVHQRYSTNTFPRWDLAHPFRFLAHNGEINTLRGNVNWMSSRQAMFQSDLLGEDVKKLFPIIRPFSSDSFSLDNALELLTLSGRSLAHAMMMLVPEAWGKDLDIDPDKRAFYEFNAAKMEPWDGPAALAFTDGDVIGATLDRNGLRPARYVVTKDDRVIMGSETGVLDIEPENIQHTWRLQPGKMFICDLKQGRIIDDDEVKSEVVRRNPYKKWVEANKVMLDNLPEKPTHKQPDISNIRRQQISFGYSVESVNKLIVPMAETGVEPLGSMGADTPPAVLSDRPQLIYSYFKQLFAQVTNPPIDPIREELVMSLTNYIGSEGNLLDEQPGDCHRLEISHPILKNSDMEKLRGIDVGDFRTRVLSTLFKVSEGVTGLRNALDRLCGEASKAIENGYNIAILSDREADQNHGAIPALLGIAAVHHHLIREGIRGKIGLVVETGEAREVHHFALLLGYGAGAINPYLVFETITNLVERKVLRKGLNRDQAEDNFIKASGKGLLKIFSKMGISTVQSYMGAQIFEAVGLGDELIDQYFTNTPSRIKGISLESIAMETITRHRSAYPKSVSVTGYLDVGGEYAWRQDGEYHIFNPDTITRLQQSTRNNDYKQFKEYTALLNNKARKIGSIRGLFELNINPAKSIPIEEVEPASEIVKRFSTGAMSFGSISKEAHETLAIAMNRLGGRSNTGEGGEDPDRFTVDENGDLRRSAIKQVASGRFGVTSYYLTNADEIQIKMAQGAKPGEGGQLPGHKVNEIIGKTRNTTPGVGLISPPPHHDIYSIEDLAQLIFDLKNSNPSADISVKLVSETGVGTIAAGVSKGKADKVLISGTEGGTGASPQSSIKHAGAPLELGLAETQQTLVLNDLRGRIKLVADGQIKTGWDIIVAALLGADEFGFATSALIVSGCLMLRNCQLNTCSVGIATQDPELRKLYSGKPEYLVNFFHFLAEEVREYMAELGYRKMDEMVGQSQRLETNKVIEHWKGKSLDLTPLLFKPDMGKSVSIYNSGKQQHDIHDVLDHKLIENAKPALEKGERVEFEMKVKNLNRTVGTILGHELTKRYGAEGLPEDTLTVHFKGTAGQSFGAFIPKGITFDLEGDSNDYVGKGLSGGKIIIRKPETATFLAEDNIIIGNTVLYGATSGEAFFNGVAGERFAVRNSGVTTVVEGVGDHGCEYMTGGKVIVIGQTGRNFAAGMSGGIAYVLDPEGRFNRLCNMQMVEFEKLENPEEVAFVKKKIETHIALTKSAKATLVLNEWENMLPRFIKVMPTDYKRVLLERKKQQSDS